MNYLSFKYAQKSHNILLTSIMQGKSENGKAPWEGVSKYKSLLTFCFFQFGLLNCMQTIFSEFGSV